MIDLDNNEAFNRIISFIQNLEFEKLNLREQKQAKKCFLDLAGVICTGAKNHTSKCMAEYVKNNYPGGNYTILATGESTNLIGAALANGMSANALDMDDGYSLLRGHPGAGFFGGLLSAAECADCTYGEFLASIVVAYELSIRQGYAIRDYYGWDHSSGSYATFATAASVGKLLHLSSEELKMALGIADFIMPVNPAKRSCYFPSMNKDGIYWGQHAGVQAVLMAQNGITGKNPVILDEKYRPYIDSLGTKFYMHDLYIKFYSCCRWAHSPIRAVSHLIKEHGISPEDIATVDIYSFGNAGTLYKEAPHTEDEAQYNIIYPIAAQIVFGNCGPLESSTDKMLDPRIEPMIRKIHFHHDPTYDAVFPGKRLSRAEITVMSGKKYVSGAFEPEGDCNADVSLEDIAAKVTKMNRIYADDSTVDAFIHAVIDTPYSAPMTVVWDKIRALAVKNIHPEIRFI